MSDEITYEAEILDPKNDLELFVRNKTKQLHDEFFMLGTDYVRFRDIITEIRNFHPLAGAQVAERYQYEYGVTIQQEFMDEFSIPELAELLGLTFRLHGTSGQPQIAQPET